jgi:hypothetical protein
LGLEKTWFVASHGHAQPAVSAPKPDPDDSGGQAEQALKRIAIVLG